MTPEFLWRDPPAFDWMSVWDGFSAFIHRTHGYIPDPRDCHHKHLFSIYCEGMKWLPEYSKAMETIAAHFGVGGTPTEIAELVTGNKA
jgi:hypothetical protein